MMFGEDYDPNLVDVPPGTPSQSQGLGLAQPQQRQGMNLGWMDYVAAAIEGAAAGYAGRAPQTGALLMRRNELMQQKEQENKRLEMQKDQLRSQKIGAFFSFLEKFDVDEDTASKAIDAMIDANPDLQEVFGDLKGKVRVTGKDKQTIKTVSTFKDGELIDPITGRAAPAGTYEVEAKNKGGKLELVSFKPAEDKGPFGKVDTEKFTAESIADFQKSGGKDYSLLKPIDKATTEEKSVGPDREALAQELGAKNFASLTQQQKAEVNTEVKRREDERLALTEKNQTRYASQFAQTMSATERRLQQTDERLRLTDEQNRRVLPSQQKVISSNRSAIKALDDYSQGYDEFLKESNGGVLSDMIRGGIAKNSKAQRAVDLVTVQGRTPAEEKLAAKYNSLVGNIKQLTDEVGVLTDVDAVRILRSFDPSLKPSQVKANISERKKSHQRTLDTQLEDLQAMGKDISQFLGNRSPAQSGAATPTMRFNPATGKVEPIR